MPITRSRKRIEFITEPLGEKGICTIPGIDEKYEKKLINEGFDKAYVILGQFLILKKDKELFLDWLIDIASFKHEHAELCYNSLNGWCEQNL